MHPPIEFIGLIAGFISYNCISSHYLQTLAKTRSGLSPMAAPKTISKLLVGKVQQNHNVFSTDHLTLTTNCTGWRIRVYEISFVHINSRICNDLTIPIFNIDPICFFNHLNTF